MAKKKPKNTHRHGRRNLFYGAVTVGERGQITIPAAARKTFDILPGDKILVFGDIEKGIGLVKEDQLQKIAMKMFHIFKSDESSEEGND
ncbi:MAG: AbrB/MazE/SpoVT family DNA-binding domain-containing protein [Candidatus Thorarchaeota archaeon]